MYQEHFGLARPIFEHSDVQSRKLYIGDSRAALLDRLKMALSTRDSVVVLTGPPGIGKSTLGCAAAGAIGEDTAIICLSATPETRQELVDCLLLAGGASSHGVGHAEGARAWKQHVMAEANRRLVVLVENAHEWSLEVLQSLNAMTAADPSGYIGVNLILTGQAELLEILAADELQALQQRIRTKHTVDAMRPAEMAGFLRSSIEGAGGDGGRLFGPGSLDLLHRYARGVPRVGENICEQALSLAAARCEPCVTAKSVRDAALEMRGPAPSGPVPRLTDIIGRRPARESTSDTDADVAEAAATDNGDGRRFDATCLAFVEPAAARTGDAYSIWTAFVARQITAERAAPVASDAEDEPVKVYDEEEYAEEIEAALRASGEN